MGRDAKVKEAMTAKTQIDYMQAPTLSMLLAMINTHNNECPDPILNDDIVDIVREGEAWVLLYYK